jgi:phosphatidylinositol N-acetylglucosaminyltransferase subunit Q
MSLSQPICTNDIRHALVWLDNWPAGLKLNTELSAAYAHALLGLVGLWAHVLASARPYLPALVRLLGWTGVGGLTLLLSFLSDALSLLTAHLYAAYLACTFVFAQMLSVAGSLWNLFRGRTLLRLVAQARR